MFSQVVDISPYLVRDFIMKEAQTQEEVGAFNLTGQSLFSPYLWDVGGTSRHQVFFLVTCLKRVLLGILPWFAMKFSKLTYNSLSLTYHLDVCQQNIEILWKIKFVLTSSNTSSSSHIIIHVSRHTSRCIRPSRFLTNTLCSLPLFWLLPGSSTLSCFSLSQQFFS